VANRRAAVSLPSALAGLAVFAAALAVVAAALAATVAGARSTAELTLSHPLPSVVREKAHVLVRGLAHGTPAHANAALELQRSYPSGSPWIVVANAPIAANDKFTIRWHVPSDERTGPVMTRVVARRHGTVIAATTPAQSAIGPAFVPCDKPVPPTVDIPTGDGWIVGGAYGIGGAYPGVDACLSQQYTVTATNSSGKVAATETVAGGHSYTLAPLPAGKYTLRAGGCGGTATVRAGRQTKANADCLYP
jgi:hypothetical protein